MKRSMLKLLAAVMCLSLCSCSVHNSSVNEQTTEELTAIETTEAATEPPETEPEITEPNGIPRVYISCSEEITAEAYCGAEIEINAGESGYPSLSASDVQIAGRGHSTWKWDKKPYKLKFGEKTSVLGLPEAKKWVLLANYADKTLIRNNVAFAMSETLDYICYTPTEYLVELYMNGEYQGIYTLGEHIDANKGRVDIEKNSAEEDTGYLLEVGGSDSDDVMGVDFFSFYMADRIVVKSPDDDKITESQFDYIFECMLAANNAMVYYGAYEDYIDVESFIDWQILHELTYNMDSCFRRSCFMVKEKGGKISMGPAWDFDLAFGNFCEDNYAYNDWVTLGPGTLDYLDKEQLDNLTHDDLTYEKYYITVTWYNYLMTDPAYVERLKARWNEVKDDLLQAANDSIDSCTTLLEPYLDANFERWDCLGKQVGYESNVWIDTYDGQIEYLRNFIEKRYNWLDAKLS